MNGYWCVCCGRLLEPQEFEEEEFSDYAYYVHDDVPHPEGMTHDEDERPQ